MQYKNIHEGKDEMYACNQKGKGRPVLENTAGNITLKNLRRIWIDPLDEGQCKIKIRRLSVFIRYIRA